MRKLTWLAALLSGSLLPMVAPVAAPVTTGQHVAVGRPHSSCPASHRYFHRGRFYNHRTFYNGRWYYQNRGCWFHR